MARLNTNISSTPVPGRLTRDDSLYRDPTPVPQRRETHSTHRDSSYSVMSPARSMTSDKENLEPHSREHTPQLATKSRRPMASTSAQLPTPTSGSSPARANKRRRTGDYKIAGSNSIYQDEDEAEEDEPSSAQQEAEQDDTTTRTTPEERSQVEVAETQEQEDDLKKYYDPRQDPELRRQLRANIRNNHREMEDKRDDIIRPGNRLLSEKIRLQNQYMGKIKQTADAALDSRVMVLASDYAGKKLNNTLRGNNGVGLDLDQLVSKCIFFMRTGGILAEEEGGASSEARGRRRTAAAEEDDDEDDSGDGLDWAVLGRQACFPSNKRPPVSGFLLGPLSVQKRVRTTQRRQAKSQRQPVGPATRPQELQQSDLQKSENTNLSHLVTSIDKKLQGHIEHCEMQLVAALRPDAALDEVEKACRARRIHISTDQELCPSLFDFVVNPSSFGQTVENLFYVSFLIREGRAAVRKDRHGLPLLAPAIQPKIGEQQTTSAQKHQAIFSIDYKTWKTLVDAFEIKEPLIPHRVPEETNVSSGGWYS